MCRAPGQPGAVPAAEQWLRCLAACMPTLLPAGRAGLDFVPRGPYALGERVVRAAAPDGSAAVLLLSVVDQEAPDASLLSCGTPGTATARAQRRRRSHGRAAAVLAGAKGTRWQGML